MNQGIKSALYFVLGICTGAGTTWYFVDKHYRKIAEDEIHKMQEYIDKKYKGRNVGRLAPTEKSEKIVEEAYKSRVNAEKQLIESYKSTIPANGTSYSTTTVTTDTPVQTTEPTEDAPEEDEERDPYLISIDEYNAIEPYYEKVGLLFDKGEDMLMDSMTSDLMDPVETIGYSVYKKLDEFKEGAYIYVRNDKISTDYEIEVRDYSDGEM